MIVDPNKTLADIILQRGEYPGAKVLRGITTAPIIHADGTIGSRGYDSSTQYYCDYQGPSINPPARPTLGDTQEALRKLKDLVRPSF